MNSEKFVFWSFIAVISSVMAAVVFWVMPKEIARTDQARAFAEQQGCEYLGSARDLREVKFMDCAGEIKMVRVK
jgi:hypothetical protein